MTALNTVMERRRSRRRLFAKTRHDEQSSSNGAWESSDSLLMKTVSITHHKRLSSIDDSVVSLDSLNSGLSSITGSHRTGMTGLEDKESPFLKVFDSEVPSKSQSCPLRPIRQGSVQRFRTLSSDSISDEPIGPSTPRHHHLALGHRRNAPLPQRQESISCFVGTSSRSLLDEEAAMHQSSHTFAKYTLEREISARSLGSSFHSTFEDSLMDSCSSIGTLDEGDEDEDSATTETDNAKAPVVAVEQQHLVKERPSLPFAVELKQSRNLRHMYARRRAGSWTKTASVRHMAARRKWTEETRIASSTRHLSVHKEENPNMLISETSDETETEASEREPFLSQKHLEEEGGGGGGPPCDEQRMDDNADDDESIDSQDSARTRRIRNGLCCKWSCGWLFNARGKHQ